MVFGKNMGRWMTLALLLPPPRPKIVLQEQEGKSRHFVNRTAANFVIRKKPFHHQDSSHFVIRKHPFCHQEAAILSSGQKPFRRYRDNALAYNIYAHSLLHVYWEHITRIVHTSLALFPLHIQDLKSTCTVHMIQHMNTVRPLYIMHSTCVLCKHLMCTVNTQHVHFVNSAGCKNKVNALPYV